MRIVRSPVFDRMTFNELLDEALTGQTCLRYGGRRWAPVVAGRSFSIYQEAPDVLGWVQDRVEAYELSIYAAMLRSHCGPDGRMRPRTRLYRGADGVYRTSYGANGDVL